MISEWPVYNEKFEFKAQVVSVDTIKDAVKAIRDVRTKMNVPPSRKALVYVVSKDKEVQNIFESSKNFFATLASASSVIIREDKRGIEPDAVTAALPNAEIYIPFKELVDIEKELVRLSAEKERLTKEIERGKNMLANPNFVSKAPEKKITEEKNKLANYESMMEKVCDRIKTLSKN